MKDLEKIQEDEDLMAGLEEMERKEQRILDEQKKKFTPRL